MILQSLVSRGGKVLDSNFPAVARRLRARRDARMWRDQPAIDTGLGFSLKGEQGIVASRDEEGETAAMRDLLNHADVMIDVGANVGFFTCLAATMGKHVLAIEPSAHNLRNLYANVRDNDLSGVEIFPVALSDHPGIMDLFGAGQGASLIRGWGGIKATHSAPTPINTLDNLLAGRFQDKRLVVKVDVEGAELSVLRGAEATLTRSPRPSWLVEIGLTENFGGAVNPHFAEIFETFWQHGYTCHNIAANQRVEPEDVRRWLATGKQDFGFINYVFKA